MDDKTLSLLTTILRVLIAVAGVVFIVTMFAGTGSDENDKPFFEALGHVGYAGAYWTTLITIFLCVLAWVIFGMTDLFGNFAERKKVLVSFGVFLILLVLGYAIASDRVFSSWAEKGVTEGTSKWVGAGLMSFYVLVSVAILSIIWSEVSRLFK